MAQVSIMMKLMVVVCRSCSHDFKRFQIRYGHGPWVSIQSRPGRSSSSLDFFLRNVGIISGNGSSPASEG